MTSREFIDTAEKGGKGLGFYLNVTGHSDGKFFFLTFLNLHHPSTILMRRLNEQKMFCLGRCRVHRVHLYTSEIPTPSRHLGSFVLSSWGNRGKMIQIRSLTHYQSRKHLQTYAELKIDGSLFFWVQLNAYSPAPPILVEQQRHTTAPHRFSDTT